MRCCMLMKQPVRDGYAALCVAALVLGIGLAWVWGSKDYVLYLIGDAAICAAILSEAYAKD